jgi:hypothetical protein
MPELVKELVNSQQNAANQTIQSAATNNKGQPVRAAHYLYTIQAGEFRQNKKMVLLK